MAYVFKLPPTVTEDIMRHAVGYPRDRLRAIAADVVRTEISKPFWKVHVRWELPIEQLALPRPQLLFDRLCLTWHNLPGFEGLPSSWKYLEYDR